MSLRGRFALAFATVALLTAGLIALAVPPIVGRGFAQMMDSGDVGMGPGMARGAGNGPGPMAGTHARQVEQETTVWLIGIALAAAGGASLLGVVLANRIARPLVTLESAAAAVAHGDLERRSGLAERPDEIGSLGRSFDAMAEELSAAEDARQRFFADAAHELKTPLSVIDATTSALLDGVYEHDDRHLATIREQSHLLGRIVDDLRTVSLAETSALPLRREPVALADLIRSSIADLAIRAEAKGVSLTAEGVSAVTVTADPDRVRQILAALLDNAIRHAPGGGRVTVSSGAPDPAFARVSVGDTGPGVAPWDLPHVFDRFYQADTARDRATGTSGLGLAVVRALALAHGGRVGVENIDGGGARFWFELPTAQVGAARPMTNTQPTITPEVTS